MKTVIVTENQALIEQAIANGDRVIVQKNEKIIGRISYDKRVNMMLRMLRVPSNVLGYKYLRCILNYALKDENYIDKGLKKYIYPQIAKEYNSSPRKVERNIRNAIRTSYLECNMELLQRVFGNPLEPIIIPELTNKQFICGVLLYINTQID